MEIGPRDGVLKTESERALPEYLKENLRIVFVGYNPGERSAQLGHNYAHPNNRFWSLLWESGLTDRRLSPEDDQKLLEYGYGLTDIVGRSSRSSSDLSAAELREGRIHLLKSIEHYHPAIVCYNGKGVYAAASGVKQVSYGLQPTSLIPGVLDFVAASPSGRSRERVELKRELYCQLRNLVHSLGVRN